MLQDKKPAENAESQKVSAPSLSLPKGGGAIRGIGEKFVANPVTGTGSVTVPIATSPGRSGFGPQLSLSYDSGAGNGPFGLGWSHALPSITRKTEKGLPRYRDTEQSDSDEFILSGAEDLVPVLVEVGEGSGKEWVREPVNPRTVNEATYRIVRYRPRIEGLFARIERWTNHEIPSDTFWRSISRDNVTTWYGRTPESRVFDPDDPSRIFSWLICESYDDKGNAIVYGYESENSLNVDRSRAHEANRTDQSRSANRYLKRIRYGNRQPYFPELVAGEPWPVVPGDGQWLFEVVLDYGEHDLNTPTPGDTGTWTRRRDPFSSYRAAFEIRTYRLCQRVLMFHHFPDEDGVGANCLVRSTDFTYRYEQEADAQEPTDPRNRSPILSVLASATQCGYKRQPGGEYLKKSLPPLEFAYSEATIDETIHEVDPESLENLPYGLDNGGYQWVDLDGEGLSGVLTEQADGWFYKPNLSPIPVPDEAGKEKVVARFAPLNLIAERPSLAAIASGRQQLLDLAGDGQVDLVELDRTAAGFYERTHDERWESFVPFGSLPVLDWNDPNLKFVDLTGDGHADILVTEDEAFCWYPSLAEVGFGPPERVRKTLDEEKGPRLVFADGTGSVYLADLSGDGLTDLVRIRNGEVCYWPNLGYGRFGAKVTMDNAPWFDAPDLFDQRRIRLGDIDGTGVTDILYLGRDEVQVYFNQSGNSWSDARRLAHFPRVDNLSAVTAVDLLGNGTACLVWSSPLESAAHHPMRYMDLMGGQKPHLLISVQNNLGAETHVRYAPSTKFYLSDKVAGAPWITRLPFPVHVVERVETSDHISRNRFVTRYAYHHGSFDGHEREFRGFGLVEQTDTEEFAALSDSEVLDEVTNIDEASHVPPVLTRTWFHTGVSLGRTHISNFFAGLLDEKDTGEYYREPGLSDEQAKELLLDDTILPEGLTGEEEREACRALKGSMLRQEVYALDGTGTEYPYGHPYTVTEQNFTIRVLQPRGDNRHGVFFTHPREAISYQYERNPADPRIAHTLTLEVDDFGNVLKEAAIAYGRRPAILVLDEQDQLIEIPNPGLSQLALQDQAKQTQTLVTYSENRITISVESPDDYRTPLPCETWTYELTDYTATGAAGRFQLTDLDQIDTANPDGEIPYEEEPTSGEQRRLIEHVRTLYRRNDLTALLPLGEIQSLALPGDTFRLAFTPGLIAQVFQRDAEPLLPNPADVLGGQGADRGGYVASQNLKAAGTFPGTDPDDHWWIPSGRVFYSPGSHDTTAEELSYARQHFFLPHRYRDPFQAESVVTFDVYDLLMVETRDALDNRVTVGERLANGNLDPDRPGNDYRVLQPWRIMDPNRNRTEVSFDALGMVVGTAVMGKPDPAPAEGDTLDGFEADLTQAQIDGFYDADDPHLPAPDLLMGATTRIIYDLNRFRHTREDHPDDPAQWLPVYAATLARETHVTDPLPLQDLRIQISFSYSDGFGREIQKKIQAEPGTLVEGLRWVGSGWTIFNNKGKPVRQYEPFFSQLPEKRHQFEFGVQVGVSPILFYDPVERVVATLHPNHTYEKVVFDPWQQTTYDVNDTVLQDPRTDADVVGYTDAYFASLPASPPAQPWHTQRQGGALGVHEQTAATKAAAHADTPTTVYFDTLGRPFLTVAHNKVVCPGHDLHGTEDRFHTRVELDIEGNQRAVRDAIEHNGDALGRVVMRYDYDLLGNRIHHASMEAGERWMLNDVTGKPIRAWDSRGHSFRSEYDPLRRPLRSFVTGANPVSPDQELLTERLVYGEQHPEPELHNLRGAPYLHFDQAGVVATEDQDFKGKAVRVSRRIANEYKQAISWSPADAALPIDASATLDPGALEAAFAPLLEIESYVSRTTYDALNRPVTLTMPHTPGMQPSVIRRGYNVANLLERADTNLHGTTTNGEPVWIPFVTNINYDAKGQRTRIDYGNGASTLYDYDPLTFRLTHLLTRRDPVAFPDDCPQPSPSGWPGCEVQNLHYTYDPAGNITHIRDEAQQTIYFKNKRVESSAEYTYDAVYRLIEATGREHLGQIGGAPMPHSHDDALRVGLLHPGDGNAMGTYIERYVYDAVGNFIEMQHVGSDPSHAGWTRSYDYSEPSLIEPNKNGNRLSSTSVGNNDTAVERYVHDDHGNTTRMPHLGGTHPDDNMHPNYRDQVLQADLGGGGTAYYTYDAAGQRVRKVWEKSSNLVEERLYLGGIEIYRRRQGTERLERETLHVMDDKQRIALIETRIVDTAGNDPAAPQLIRYQLGNHLGSASLELDQEAQIISYEEYTPYGSTSYQAVRGVTETPKRYGYTGKERDEETGLYYHGARYYAPWLGRWTAADPAELVDGPGLYNYCKGSPVTLLDPNGTDTGVGGASTTPWLEQGVRGAGPGKPPESDIQRVVREQEEALARVQPRPIWMTGEPPSVSPEERQAAETESIKAYAQQQQAAQQQAKREEERAYNYARSSLVDAVGRDRPADPAQAAMDLAAKDPVAAAVVIPGSVAVSVAGIEDPEVLHYIYMGLGITGALLSVAVSGGGGKRSGRTKSGDTRSRRNLSPRFPSSKVMRKANLDIPTLRVKYPDGSREYIQLSTRIRVRYDARGNPDYSPYLYKGGINTVPIDYTGNRRHDTAAANAAAGYKRRPKGYTWHHASGRTMQLVRSDVHDAFRHVGEFARHKAGE
jgi:RHS repeat-associated protein